MRFSVLLLTTFLFFPTFLRAQDAEHGRAVALRVLEQNPKLKISVLSGQSFPKPGGIELMGAGTATPSIGFILPEAAWTALAEGERKDLAAYVAGQVAQVRAHAEEYMIIPRSAPDYQKDLGNVRRIAEGAWYIGSTESYPDDPAGNLYLKAKLVKGPATH